MQQLSSLNKNGGKVILWLLILCMFGFTIVRSLHFLQQTLPADQQYVAFLALAAFDIGVLGWLYYAMHSASGVNQRVIAYGMIFVCSGGVIATTIADMLMVSSANGVVSKQPAYIGTVALWAVMLVIALNFLSGILVHLVDTSHVKHMSIEAARDQITAASLAAIVNKAAEISPHIAQLVAEEWQNEITREMIGHLVPKSTTPLLPEALPKIVESTILPVAPDPATQPIAPTPTRTRYRHFYRRQTPGEHRTPPIPLEDPGTTRSIADTEQQIAEELIMRDVEEASAASAKKNKLPRMRNAKSYQPAGNTTS